MLLMQNVQMKLLSGFFMQRFNTRDGNYQIEVYDGSDVRWITFDHAGLPSKPIEKTKWLGSGFVTQAWRFSSLHKSAASMLVYTIGHG